MRERSTTETKHALKTTEFYVFLGVTVLLLIAAAVTTANGGSDNDVFSAEKAWLYVTILASAYLVSRGLAKSGSQDPYTHDPNRRDGDGIGERVKGATAVLTGDAGVPNQRAGDGHDGATVGGSERSDGPGRG